jgi:DNA-binding transcriptional MerR regulator
MRIGELAKRSGLSRDTIRFYEREGLIESEASAEKSNDYRDYSEEMLERLGMIDQARSAGFSVADLQKWFLHVGNLEKNAEGAERFIDEKAAELRNVISKSKKLLKMLQQTKAALKKAP